jgi:hypothetical protein
VKKTWRFPESNYSISQGAGRIVNDEFNNFPLNNLSREIIQNSLDARLGNERVTVQFHHFHLPKESFPEIAKYFEYVLRLYRQYNQLDTPKEKIIVNNMLRALNSNTMSWLRISDFNTTGLWGASSPSSQKTPWFAFIKSAGKNQKVDTAGGSKGLGKDAIFTNSILKTMFVSTYTKNLISNDEELSSIGIAKLLSLTLDEENPNNPDYTQGVGFYVDDQEEALKYLSHSSELLDIDPEYDRKKMGYGTDIYLPCFANEDGWDDTIITESIISFLPAIMDNQLKVIVSYDNTTISHEIDSSNMAPFISGKKASKKEARALYNVFKSTNTKIIKHEKSGFEMTLYLLQDALDGLDSVYQYRLPTKMKIIEEKVISSVGYTGILLIEGDELCKRLRSVENATHNRWSVGRYKETDYSKTQIEEAIRTVSSFVSEECEKFGIADQSDAIYYNVAGWNSEEDIEDMSIGEHSEIGLPTTEVVFDMKTDTVKNTNRKPYKKKGNVIDINGNAESDILDIGTPGEEGEISTHPSGNSHNGSGGIHPGVIEVTYDPNKGEKAVLSRKTISAINARIPAVEPSEGFFDLVFIPSKTGTDVNIELSKLSVEGEIEATNIITARMDQTNLLIKDNKIHLDKIEKGRQYRIHLKLEENSNYIWEVNIDAEE